MKKTFQMTYCDIKAVSMGIEKNQRWSCNKPLEKDTDCQLRQLRLYNFFNFGQRTE